MKFESRLKALEKKLGIIGYEGEIELREAPKEVTIPSECEGNSIYLDCPNCRMTMECCLEYLILNRFPDKITEVECPNCNIEFDLTINIILKEKDWRK